MIRLNYRTTSTYSITVDDVHDLERIAASTACAAARFYTRPANQYSTVTWAYLHGQYAKLRKALATSAAVTRHIVRGYWDVDYLIVNAELVAVILPAWHYPGKSDAIQWQLNFGLHYVNAALPPTVNQFLNRITEIAHEHHH